MTSSKILSTDFIKSDLELKLFLIDSFKKLFQSGFIVPPVYVGVTLCITLFQSLLC